MAGELSVGELGEFGSCSFVFFFLRNPRVGMEASVTRSWCDYDREVKRT